MSGSVLSKDGHLPHNEGKDTFTVQMNPVVVGRPARPTSRRAPKAHRMMDKTLQRHCARSSVTNVLSLKQSSPQPTSLSNLLEIHEINFEENWRYRTLSKLETLF